MENELSNELVKKDFNINRKFWNLEKRVHREFISTKLKE